MKKDKDFEMKDIMEDMADEIGQNRDEEEDFQERPASSGFLPQSWFLALVGVGVLILIAIFALFFGGGRGKSASTEELNSLKTKLEQIEKRLTKLESTGQNVGRLEERIKGLQDSLSKVDKISQKIDRLEKAKVAVVAPKQTEPAPTAQKKPLPQPKKRYHEVRAGETLFQIAKKYGTSVSDILRVNNFKKNQDIYPGQKILIP
ncbi:MAG: LysM peptidoglycan-binding domain-containing protein [Pseudomonadota bacterium]